MASVHVENIASQTTEKEVRDFFSFWYAAPRAATQPFAFCFSQC